jgi:hypothetical protein
VAGPLAAFSSLADVGIYTRYAVIDIDVRIDHLENVPTQRRRRRRSSWKGLDLGALYESVRWILYSNK